MLAVSNASLLRHSSSLRTLATPIASATTTSVQTASVDACMHANFFSLACSAARTHVSSTTTPAVHM